MLDWVAEKIGFVRASAVAGEMQAARAMGFSHHPAISARFQLTQSVAEQLDEHRALVEQISSNTCLFEDQPMIVKKMAFQDDYLMRLFKAVHGVWPDDRNFAKDQQTSEAARPRPFILGICGLHEYHSRR
jgi:hypothetical protein